MDELSVDPRVRLLLCAADRLLHQADGLCYIEMELVSGHFSARASQSQVAAGANVVIDGCIRGKNYPKGGLAEHISECLNSDLPHLPLQALNVIVDGDLSLSVGVIETSWSFTRCYGVMPPLAEASCRHLLNRMDTAPEWLFFGSEPGPDVDVVLPITLFSRAYLIYRIGQHMP